MTYICPPRVWKFLFRGYQVLDKWLKERKGRDLSPELEHFLQVVEALRETVRIMKGRSIRFRSFPKLG